MIPLLPDLKGLRDSLKNLSPTEHSSSRQPHSPLASSSSRNVKLRDVSSRGSRDYRQLEQVETKGIGVCPQIATGSVVDEFVVEPQRETPGDTNCRREESFASSTLSPRHGRARRSQSSWFQYLTFAVISANIAVIAIEASYIQNESLKGTFTTLELLFTAFYIVEITVRVKDSGWVDFFTGKNWGWNIFDFLTTLSATVDGFLELFANAGSSGTQICRLSRILRITRVLRILRCVRFIDEIGHVVKLAIAATAKLAVIVLLVNFISGIIVTNLLWDAKSPVVSGEFYDLRTSMWSLFQLMTLDNWSQKAGDVLHVMPTMWIFYVLFVFISSTALMSLVPAIFIELNMEAHEREKEELALLAKQEKWEKERKKLGMLFERSDIDGTGAVPVHRLQFTLTDPGSIRELEDGGMCQPGEARNTELDLFDLLDMDRDLASSRSDGKLRRHEFVDRIMEMRKDVDIPGVWRAGQRTLLRVSKLEAELREQVNASREQHARILQQMDSQKNSTDCLQADVSRLGGKIDALGEHVQKIGTSLELILAKLEDSKTPRRSGSCERAKKSTSRTKKSTQPSLETSTKSLPLPQASAPMLESDRSESPVRSVVRKGTGALKDLKKRASSGSLGRQSKVDRDSDAGEGSTDAPSQASRSGAEPGKVSGSVKNVGAGTNRAASAAAPPTAPPENTDRGGLKTLSSNDAVRARPELIHPDWHDGLKHS